MACRSRPDERQHNIAGALQLLDSFKLNEKPKRRQMTHCNRCGHTSIHRVEVEFVGRWDDGEGFFGGEEHRILRCGGCDTIRYTISSWDNSNHGEDENGETFFPRTTEIFPAQKIKTLDADYLFNVPSKIYRVLSETLDAQSNNNLILATIGLRVLIETICVAASCSSKNLIGKINDLEKSGLITVSERDLFQKVREFGNKGAHSGEAMSADQIASGLDISVHLLGSLFVEPAKKKALFDKAKKNLAP